MVFQIKTDEETVIYVNISIVELEQANPDIILRADGMGLAVLQAILPHLEARTG